MQNIFSSLGMTTATIAVSVVELVAIVVMSIGALCYRNLIGSRLAFLSSLHHEEKQTQKASFGVLAWIYILSTLLIVLLTGAMFLL